MPFNPDNWGNFCDIILANLSNSPRVFASILWILLKHACNASQSLPKTPFESSFSCSLLFLLPRSCFSFAFSFWFWFSVCCYGCLSLLKLNVDTHLLLHVVSFVYSPLRYNTLKFTIKSTTFHTLCDFFSFILY